MAKTQALPGTTVSRRFAKCPTTVKSGDFCLIGDIAGVALDDYSSLNLGTTFECGGTFQLAVLAATVISPLTGSTAKQGAKLYADGGTLDSTTNVTTGATIDLNSGGTFIGWLDPQYLNTIASGTTDTAAWVLLKGIN